MVRFFGVNNAPAPDSEGKKDTNNYHFSPGGPPLTGFVAPTAVLSAELFQLQPLAYTLNPPLEARVEVDGKKVLLHFKRDDQCGAYFLLFVLYN